MSGWNNSIGRRRGVGRRLALESLEPRTLLAADALVISEFMASNQATLADEEGDFSDWLEIYNSGADRVDLDGMYLADAQDQWQFPAVEVEPGGYLVVFASGKDRAEVGGELHTNFKLDRDGERLALLAADGTTVLDQYPTYPPQLTDVSYGVDQQRTATTLIDAGSSGRLLVPDADDATTIGATWQGLPGEEPFDDSGWQNVTLGVGYDGIGVDPGTAVENVALFKPTTQSSDGFGFSGIQGTDGDPSNFTHTATGDVTPFWEVDLEGRFLIDRVVLFNRTDCCAERLYNITVDVYDASGAILYSSPVLNPVAEGQSPSSPGPSLTLDLATELGGLSGSRLRVNKTAVNGAGSSEWLSLGEVEVYGTQAEPYRALIEDDIEDMMRGVNSSVYVRLPFNLEQAPNVDTLALETRYDDGLIAYLNGTEIARGNAPAGVPSFDAAATATHDGTALEVIGLPPTLLRDGPNILAIHGLNSGLDDDDFLLLPRLTASQVAGDQAGYFSSPSPGTVNGTSFAGFVGDTSFDVDRGFYNEPFDVRIATATPGATIIYTTDGSVPSLTNGTQFTAPDADTSPVAIVTIATTTTLRAIALKDSFSPTNVDTQTYVFPHDVIRQPAAPPGMPAVWNGIAQSPINADYEMDPEVVDNPAYHDAIIEGLTSIPTLSIVMDPDDLFGQERGIYINSGQRGRAWEHPTSIEILEPDGDGFQVDAGIRIHGFSWRFHRNTPKHSFRLEFRSEYGPTRLDYPLFPDAPVDRFDSIVLRAQGGRAWAGLQNPEQAQYIRDVFARDTARDMGKVDGHGGYIQLYLNGFYWGLYHAVERPDAQMGEEYFGGSDADYDALNRRTSTNEAIDGDLDRYNQLLALADQMLVEAAAGHDTSATYAAIDAYLDIDNLIDFFLIHQYTTNRDGPEIFQSNNQRAIGSRTGDPDFKFFVWDMEYSMWNATDRINIDVDVPTSASHVYTALRTNPEFRICYADRAHQFLTHGGALTPAAAAARWQARADEIDAAVVAESARWGDAKRSVPFTRDVEWREELDRLMTDYFPVRTDVLLQQFTAAGLYPTVESPELSQYGGQVPSGYSLEMTVGTTTPAENLALGKPVSQSTNGFGFDGSGAVDGDRVGNSISHTDTGDLAPYLEIDLGQTAAIETIDLFTRDNCCTPNQPERDYNLQVEIRDAGGTLVYSSPIVNPWDGSGSSAPDLGNGFVLHVDLTDAPGGAVSGQHIRVRKTEAFPGSEWLHVAEVEVHGEIDDPDPSPTAIYYTLDGSTDPRIPGGAVNPSPAVLQYAPESPPVITHGVTVRTRTLRDGHWSALTEATFRVAAAADADNLRITEINYNPPDANLVPGLGEADVDNDQFEFFELMNVGSQPIDLAGVQLRGADSDPLDRLDFTFAPMPLSPHERVVVVRHLDAFASRYGTGLHVAGVYSGKLPNGGDSLTVLAADGSLIEQFSYDDSATWPDRADGGGSSLEIVDATGASTSVSNWRASHEFGGTPAAAGTGPVDSVIVNEVLSRTVDPSLDQVELLNTTTTPIDLAGWHLSDTSANYFRYTFPAGVIIAPGDYLVLDQSQLGFALSGQFGDDIWLLQGDPDRAGKPLRFADHVRFDATETSVSLGLWPSGDPGGTLFPMTQPTFGAVNSGPRLGDAIISELHYHPAPPPAGGSIGMEDLEFVEIYNRSGSPLPLDDWRVDGFGFRFPVGVMLQPAATIVVVPFDPAAEPAKAAAFQAVYGIDQTPTLLGPATGSLQDGGETIKLLRPEQPSVPTGYLLVDQLPYDNQAPWPPEADGDGWSLARITADAFGSLPASWTAGLPTPGATTIFQPGDVNADGQINGLDVAPFVRLLLDGPYHVAADMDSDGGINGLDVAPFVAAVVGPGLAAYDPDWSQVPSSQRRGTVPVVLSQALGSGHTPFRSIQERTPHRTRRIRAAVAGSVAEPGLDAVRVETRNWLDEVGLRDGQRRADRLLPGEGR